MDQHIPTAEQARATKWWKRSKAEREAIYQERNEDINRKMVQRLDRIDGDAPATTSSKHDAQFEGVKVRGELLHIKSKGAWPVAECEAIVDHGANLGSRITATRVVLTGPFALLLKKNKNKVFLAITTTDDVEIIEVKAKHEGDARRFAAKVNSAAKHYTA